VNTLLFVGHTANVPALRTLARLFGEHTRVFGGEAFTTFVSAREIISRELEKIDWFSGPIDDRADYLTKSYMPFLLAGPNHTLRREHIVARVAAARARLGELEALLKEESDSDRALARFLFRHLCKVELNAKEVDWLLRYRRFGQPMILLPKLLRNTLLRPLHDELQARRLHFLQRIEDAGEPLADSWFDIIWFQTATLSFYPRKALETLRKQPELQMQIRDELSLPSEQRVKTRALVHEMLRIHGRIASTNYVEAGRVRIALLASAVVDPARYRNPNKVDLSRDHSDTLAFSGPAPTRKCPGELFAPDAMAAIVAHEVRAGWLEQQRPTVRSGNGAGHPQSDRPRGVFPQQDIAQLPGMLNSGLPDQSQAAGERQGSAAGP
jgi:hypothetical protein